MVAKDSQKNHNVEIVPDGGGSSWRVDPREVHAYSRDKVTFRNGSKGRVSIMIPDAGLFGQDEMIPIEPGNQEERIILGHSEETRYPYVAYCHNSKEFAHASIPIIIIYPTPA
jgi:hypothetical protein